MGFFKSSTFTEREAQLQAQRSIASIEQRMKYLELAIDLVSERIPQFGYGEANGASWQTLRVSVTSPREAPVWFVISPPTTRRWKAVLNMAMTASGTDKFLVRVEVKIPDYSGPQPEIVNKGEYDYAPDPSFVQTDLYDVWMASVRPDNRTGGGRYLHINDAPHSPSPLMFVEPPIGPWEARLSIAQYGGINSLVPFLIY